MATAVNRFNPRKLLHSKWTAVQPRNREKHFLVTDVFCDEAGVPQSCLLEAVHSHRELRLEWRELKDTAVWLIGWK